MEGGDGTDADWTRTHPQVSGGLPGEVRMLRLRAKSSLRAVSTAVMSVVTSSRSTMSPTRAELMLTLADWPLTLAGRGDGKEIQAALGAEAQKSVSSLTFSLLGGVEPDVAGAGEGGGLLEPGGHSGGSSDLSHQQGAQQVQPTESHNCPEGGRNAVFRVPAGTILQGALNVPFIAYLHVRGRKRGSAAHANALTHTHSLPITHTNAEAKTKSTHMFGNSTNSRT